ncbi:hypothetical protein IFM89_018093, partial [Coptis chinensis]
GFLFPTIILEPSYEGCTWGCEGACISLIWNSMDGYCLGRCLAYWGFASLRKQQPSLQTTLPVTAHAFSSWMPMLPFPVGDSTDRDADGSDSLRLEALKDIEKKGLQDGLTGDKSHVSTRVMGTYGYVAPEYLALVY